MSPTHNPEISRYVKITQASARLKSHEDHPALKPGRFRLSAKAACTRAKRDGNASKHVPRRDVIHHVRNGANCRFAASSCIDNRVALRVRQSSRGSYQPLSPSTVSRLKDPHYVGPPPTSPLNRIEPWMGGENVSFPTISPEGMALPDSTPIPLSHWPNRSFAVASARGIAKSAEMCEGSQRYPSQTIVHLPPMPHLFGAPNNI